MTHITLLSMGFPGTLMTLFLVQPTAHERGDTSAPDPASQSRNKRWFYTVKSGDSHAAIADSGR
ncbi:hypothetical protein [Roseovarius sp. M141]|uniref:hypothetical protein n=1 Tax=Roseovarius sp. M141 TaxID=2583806 RepID=UPI0020CE5EA6|nr:hypothetical protein [Roseovarius sp. M141]